MKAAKTKTIAGYAKAYPKSVQVLLEQVRRTIERAAPGAEEAIRYGIPTSILNGNLVHFGAFKHHIGFYPGPKGIAEFVDELANYKTSKGAVQFPLSEPLPLKLIEKIVRLRVKQNRKIGKKRHSAGVSPADV